MGGAWCLCSSSFKYFIKILSDKEKKSAYDNWMKELRETAFIEISLFDDSIKALNPDMLGSNQNMEKEGVVSGRKELSPENRDNLGKQTKKEQMEEKWVEMYKSVEKTKNRTSGRSISSIQTLNNPHTRNILFQSSIYTCYSPTCLIKCSTSLFLPKNKKNYNCRQD